MGLPVVRLPAQRRYPRLLPPSPPACTPAGSYSAAVVSGFRRGAFTTAPTPACPPGTSPSFDRAAPADLAFDTNGRTPLLFANDGGLLRTADGGLVWKLTGWG